MATLGLGGRRRGCRRRVAAGRHLASRRDAFGRRDRIADRRARGLVRRQCACSERAAAERRRRTAACRSCMSRPRPKARRSRASTAARGSADRSSGPTTLRGAAGSASSSGGSGKGLRQVRRASTRSTEYRYFANFAVALCEGEITASAASGPTASELDIARRRLPAVSRGAKTKRPTSDQRASSVRQCAPAYRGTAYIVFEDLPLREFGNRMPQLSFEVHRARSSRFGEQIRGVVTDPGHRASSSMRPSRSRRAFGVGARRAENVHTLPGRHGLGRRARPAAGDAAQRRSGLAGGQLVRYRSARGHCQLRPGVERDGQDDGAARLERRRRGAGRRLSGQPRAKAGRLWRHAVGSDSRGGDPGSQGARARRDRSTPFILMDVPAGNTLADPYGGAGAASLSLARAHHLSSGGRPAGHAGQDGGGGDADRGLRRHGGAGALRDRRRERHLYRPGEWSLPPHDPALCASLRKAAGGVDAFLIGIGVARPDHGAQFGASTYPFVAALMASPPT